jgi:metal-responsive CopG/Arc/MetJ family transcriptional regulator
MKSSDDMQMVHMRVDVTLLKRLDDFRFKHRFESRSEAARWLMKLALDQKPTPRTEGRD